MVVTNMIIGILMLSVIAVAGYWATMNHKRYKNNMVTAHTLDELLKSTVQIIEKKKPALKQQKRSISDLYDPSSSVPTDLESPAVLSTIVTVLVKKYGEVRLSMKDFMIPNEEYVSVYVDTTTSELILSVNHSLESSDPYPIVGFTDPDDNTFH
jgi:Tfp pilus assembly protein PilO